MKSISFIIQIALVFLGLIFSIDSVLLAVPFLAWPMWSFFWFAFRAGVKEFKRAFPSKGSK